MLSNLALIKFVVKIGLGIGHDCGNRYNWWICRGDNSEQFEIDSEKKDAGRVKRLTDPRVKKMR